MPFFGKKKKEDSQKEALPNAENISNNNSKSISEIQPYQTRKPKFSFHCQFAHGGPTGLISGFRNIKELYVKIAECYEILAEDILFCTLNTHKVDMNHLLGSHIGLDDFIFVHIKGQKKEVDICKTEDSLGLTITDNGAGRAFIKRIRESSQISKLGHGLIDVGDHIEKINNESFVGMRHYDIAKKLRSISVGTKFTLRLISPEKSSIYANLSRRSEYGGSVSTKIIHGKKTIRINASNAYEEETIASTQDELAIEAITKYVERALGISDMEMAQNILDIGKNVKNPTDFIAQMNDEMGEFEFSNNLIYDFWGVITDAKAGILTSSVDTVSCGSKITRYSTLSEETVYEDRL